MIAIADPSQLMMIDEIGLLLGKPRHHPGRHLSQITDILKKTEQSQRVLEEASEDFALDVIREDESADETISIEKLTGESDTARSSAWSIPRSSPPCSGAPVIFTSRRRDDSVVIKYRIDGVLHRPCSQSRKSITRPSFRVSRS